MASIVCITVFWTLLAVLGGSLGRPAHEMKTQSEDAHEVEETTTTILPMQTSTLLHMLHPNASDLIYGDTDSLIRQKRCCCCDCCCCCCGGGSGSSEEGVAIGDMIAMASLVQSQMQAVQQAAQQSETAGANTAALQNPAGLAGFLPYPLVPRSVNWDTAPAEAKAIAVEHPSKKPVQEPRAIAVAIVEAEQQPEENVQPRMQPGGECVEDEDCVHGASCMREVSWSGDVEKRCVCRPPFLHVGQHCVAPDV